LATKLWSSTAPPEEFQPYIDSERGVPEFTLRAILAGIVAGLFFGAVTVYVGSVSYTHLTLPTICSV